MGVKLAETAGFCMGVRRAVDRVLDAARRDRGPIYTYGPLIHNPQTVELLKKRGIMPVGSIAEIPAGAETTLVIRAHGISPAERQQIKARGVRIIDATCPKVGRVQAIIKKYAARGYGIVIVGDAGHPEVTGLLGYAAGRGVVVGTEEEAARIPYTERLGIVAQTTQDTTTYDDIINVIKGKMPQALVFNTICDSTGKRQTEIKELAAQMDAIVIVGGSNSANTRRLVELAEHQGKPTFYIETAEELKNHSWGDYAGIGVSAGASTPNWIIDRVVNDITGFQAQGGGKSRPLFNFWLFLIRTDIYSALGAGSIYLAATLLQGNDAQGVNFGIASLYVFAMHILNRFTDHKINVIGSVREESYQKHEVRYIFLALGALLTALVLALTQGAKPFLFLLLLSLAGVLYNAPLLPNRWRFHSLKEIPGSKNVSMALAWAMVTSVLPAISAGNALESAIFVAFAFAFAFVMVFIRSVFFDILDMQNDRLMGWETIPVVIGRLASLRLLRLLWVLLVVLLAVAFPVGWTPSVSWALIICPFYLLICSKLYDRRAAFSLSGMELWGFLETNYIIAGVVGILWFACVRAAA